MPRGGVGGVTPLEKTFGKNLKGWTKVKFAPSRFLRKFKRKPQRGDQRIFFGLNLEMSLKIVSFSPPFEISIEFLQKSLKNYDFR
jgi:hypothetical protein